MADDIAQIKPSSHLAFKFAWRVSVVIALLILLVGVVMAVSRKNETTALIDAKGAMHVSSIAAHGLDYWRRFSQPGEGNPLTIMANEDLDIINILVVEPEDEQVGKQFAATAREADAYSFKWLKENETHPDRMNAIEILEGTAQEPGQAMFNVRLFRHPVASTDGAPGSVWLILSAERVREQAYSFLTTLVLVGLIAVGLGIGCSFLLASLVTRPIRGLATDMNVISRGNLDHKARVHGTDEIGMLGRAFNRMIVSLKDAQEKEVERLAIERELNVAHEIQSRLLPSELPNIPQLELCRYYQAAKEVGGDYYDFIPLDGKHLGVVVADVSGKGVPGSMVMTMVRSILRYESRGLTSAAETLKRVNRLVAADIKRGMFVTAIYLVIDISTGKLTMASAGHNPMVYWKQREGKVGLVNPRGMALGIDRGPAFDDGIDEITIQMHPGDRLVAYTDGIVEAMNANNEEFGEKPFYTACQRLAALDSEQFVTEAVQEVRNHQGAADQHDDITLVTLRYLGV